MKTTTSASTIIVKNGIELNTEFTGYCFEYDTNANGGNNDVIPQGMIILLESLLKLGKREFNKAMHEIASTNNSKVYEILHNMQEVSYVSNPYDLIVYYCVDLNTGKINKNNLRKLIKKVDPSIKLMGEDYILNRGLFFTIIAIISKYNGMTVRRNQIHLPRYIVNKCLYKMKKDGYELKIENGYEYVRDLLKDTLKNK